MKNRIFRILLLACFMIACAGVAYAAPLEICTLVDVPQITILGTENDNNYYYVGSQTQTIYRLVTTEIAQDGADPVVSTNPMPVATVTYSYEIVVGKSSGVIRGGTVDAFPDVKKWDDYRLNLTAYHGASPTINSAGAAPNGSDYAVSIRGGHLVVTYNQKLYYSSTNQFLQEASNATSTTVQIIYSFDRTAPLSELRRR